MKEQVQILVAAEASRISGTDPNPPATLRVYEKLRASLAIFAGQEGFMALMRRALYLARAEDASLDAVELRDDGSLQGLEQVSDDSAVCLLASLLSLLATFVGDSLTLRLVGIAIPETPSSTPDTKPRSK